MIVIKIIRVLKFNKGHLIIMGTNLIGKQSLSHFSAFTGKQNFIEIDETILEKSLKQEKSDKLAAIKDNLAFWNKYIKRILSDIVYKNSKYVLYFGSKIMENVI